MIITHHFKYKYLNYIIVTFLLLEYTGILGHNCQSLYQDITSTLNINAREYRRGNQKRTIQRNWQHRLHKTQDENKGQRIRKGQLKKDNPEKFATRRQTKQPHNTMCVGQRHTQTNTENVNKTCALQQTTGGKDDPNIVFIWKS